MMRIFGLLVAFSLLASPCAAQDPKDLREEIRGVNQMRASQVMALSALPVGSITVEPAENSLYKLLRIGVERPETTGEDEKVYYRWRFDSGVDFELIGAGKNVRAAATPGKHTAFVRIVTIDWVKRKYDEAEYETVFLVAGVGPIIPDPIIPDPVVEPLCEIVPDQAADLSRMYAGQAEVVETTLSLHFDDFIAAHDSQLRAKDLAGHAAEAIILSRLQEAAGTLEGDMTGANIDSLQAELEKLADELTCGDDIIIPDPIDGPEQPLFILVAESTNPTPQRAALLRMIRIGKVAAYLNSKGYVLELIDPDSQMADGTSNPRLANIEYEGTPGLYVLEEETLEPFDSMPLLVDGALVDDTTILKFLRKYGD
jgi:hypothetical protein